MQNMIYFTSAFKGLNELHTSDSLQLHKDFFWRKTSRYRDLYECYPPVEVSFSKKNKSVLKMHLQENSAVGTYTGLSTAGYPLQMDFGVPFLSHRLPCRALGSVPGAVLLSCSWIIIFISLFHRNRPFVSPGGTGSYKHVCKKNT